MTRSCPICGGRSFVKVRRGGRAYLKAWREYGQGPTQSIRVYWPQKDVHVPWGASKYRICPHPIHQQPSRYSRRPPNPYEYDGVNKHADTRPARKAKAQRHRASQGRDRR